MGKKITEFDSSAFLNTYSYMKYLDKLKELAMCMFEWKNLPSSIDERYLELALFERGKCVYFDDDVLGNLCLKCAIGGRLNVYNIPIERRAYANNGYQRQLNDKNSVIIYNNYLHKNTLSDMQYYAIRIWELDRTIDINANAQKTPILISCDDNERLSMEQVYMKYVGNQPVICGTKNLSPNSIQVLRTDAPYVADKLMDLKNQIWNEALTELGIENIAFQKRERMINTEATQNAGKVYAYRYTRLNERIKAAKEINKMFGTNITVEYRKGIEEMADMPKEGENNE